MGGIVFCLPMALLFLASAIPSEAQKGAGEETRVTVAAGAPLTVECRLRPEQRAEWQRDGAPPPGDLRAEPEAAADARLAARLTADAARAHHAGLYTCSRARDHRVRVVVLPATAAAAAGDAAVTDAAAGGAASAAGDVVVYELRGNLTLACGLENAAGVAYTWTKNETDLASLPDMKGRYELQANGAVLHVARTLEDDFGNYSCSVGGQQQRWEARGLSILKVSPNTNVVEGQKMKVQCKVIGKPYPRLTWQYSNDSEHWVDALAALGGRAELAASEQGVPDGALTVAAAARTDAGKLRCLAPAAAPAHDPKPAETTVRVKDMYAALWPFLGICAEVFVLCAVILVYERRRTKPEADDSDVDTDQKKS